MTMSSIMDPLLEAAHLQVESVDGPGMPLNALAPAHAAPGLVEQEFRLSGTAARYRFPAPEVDAERIDDGHAYATRLLVRRPADASRFNGTVVVEWLNVSAGQDLDFVYAAARELIARAGIAWVGVSAQRVGVERLAAWNPQRYAGLTVAAPADNPADANPLDPADVFTGAAGGDVLCWDIFSHAALVLRHQPDLLGLPAVRVLVAAGESQSAFRLSRYFNALQPALGLYDGFLLYDRGGPHALRQDVPAKLIAIGSEFFAEYAGTSPPDCGNQRWWELAGAGHVSLDEMENYIDPQVRRDRTVLVDGRALGLSDVMAQGREDQAPPMWSRVPNGDLVKAALHALDRWITLGIEPVGAPRLQLSAADAQGTSRLLRDADGRVYGGVRYAAYEVPTATNVGVTDGPPRLAGFHLDFTPKDLQRRYGSAQRYQAQVDSVVQANLVQGFLLPEEAQRVLTEARRVRFDR